MIGAVALPYLPHPLRMRDRLPSRASRQITKDERIVGDRSLLGELSKQNILQATHPRLIDSTRVMGHQTAEPIVSAQLAKEPAAINGMKARIVQARCIANVMQPCRCHQNLSSHTRDRCQPLCLSGYRPNMLPPARQHLRQLRLREFPCDVASHHIATVPALTPCSSHDIRTAYVSRPAAPRTRCCRAHRACTHVALMPLSQSDEDEG